MTSTSVSSSQAAKRKRCNDETSLPSSETLCSCDSNNSNSSSNSSNSSNSRRSSNSDGHSTQQENTTKRRTEIQEPNPTTTTTPQPPATTTSSSQASPFPHHPPPPPPNLLTNTAALRQAIHGNLHQIVDHIEGMQWQGCLMLVSAVLAVQQNVGDSIFSGVLGGQGSARGEWQDFLLTQLGIWKDELRGVERVSSDVIVRGGDGGSGGGSGRDPGDKRNCQTRRWKEEVGENGLVILDFTGDDDSDNKG